MREEFWDRSISPKRTVSAIEGYSMPSRALRGLKSKMLIMFHRESSTKQKEKRGGHRMGQENSDEETRTRKTFKSRKSSRKGRRKSNQTAEPSLSARGGKTEKGNRQIENFRVANCWSGRVCRRVLSRCSEAANNSYCRTHRKDKGNRRKRPKKNIVIRAGRDRGDENGNRDNRTINPPHEEGTKCKKNQTRPRVEEE